VGSGDKFTAAVASVVTATRTLPMMSPMRVVIVAWAEALLMPKRESDAATRALDTLEELLKKPESQTVLVLVAGGVDKRSRLFKLLLKQATIVECGAIEDQADAERWIKARVATAKMDIDPAAARLLAERGGTDVKRLRNDVDRLVLYAMGQKLISKEDVREVVGPAALQDDWAMTNAIEAGNVAQALRQLALLLDAGSVPEKILGQLGWVVRSKFAGLAPTGLREATDAVFRTDLDLKSSAGDARVLLERLVVELCAKVGTGGRPGAGMYRRRPV
ncbi:MAG TPA: DNA polymerase III subunit delta, partial [Vicinamibacterales bacterium]|nr:DNA polymerase III subunit delta [Vicinamibacterales bacterium]